MTISHLTPKHRSQAPSSVDVHGLRERAQENLHQGAVTADYTGDLAQAIRLLNEALATEIVCVLRYKHHYFTASGIMAEPIAEQFREHAEEEQEHADRIAYRIHQLGGNPELNPALLAERSHSQYQEGETLLQMIEEDLIAERIAIDSYRNMIRFFGDADPTSRRLMEDVLAKEEEHAAELASFLATLDPSQPG